MKALILLTAFFPLAASAQIQPDMATTFDGQQLYFSTALRLQGSDEASYLKIFRYAASGNTGRFSLYRQLNLVVQPGLQPNFYQAERPSVSANGDTVAYTAASSCFGGSACVYHEYYEGEISSGGAPDSVLGGQLTLSPDGAFVLSMRTGFSDATPLLYSLPSGNQATLTGYRMIGPEKQAVANGGAVLLTGPDGLVIWKAGQTRRLNISGEPFNAVLSGDAGMVVYEITSGPEFQLHAYSVGTGSDVMLAASTPLYSNNQPAPATLFFDPCVSADGSLVSYVLNGRLWIQQTNGTGARQLSSPPDTVTAHVLSGSGAVAYAATASSRILQIDVGSGLATELSAPAPHLEIVGGAQVPGALLEVSVSNVTGRDDPALEGIAAPVIARSPQFTTLQIPWEQMPGAVLNLVASVNPSQFEEVDPIELQTALPGFLPSPLGLAPNGFPYALAFHQNFAGMVTPARPAASGEILSIYMTGLGSVSPSISTGAVTPSSSLYLLQTPFSCTWNTRPATVANILFAGLAPGMVGVEQVNIQTPVVSGALTDLLLECESQEPIGSIGSDATIPAGTAPVIHPGPRK